MITQKEKQLGSLFAKLAATGVAANFVVGIVLIGPDSVGYSSTYGPLQSVIGFVTNFAWLAILMYGSKICDAENNPYFRLVSNGLFVMVAFNLMNAFVGPSYETATNTLFSTSEISDIYGANWVVWNVFFGLYVLVFLRSAGKELLPRWGVIFGTIVGYTLSWFPIALAFITPPDIVGIILGLGVGVISYPIFIFSISKAFDNA